MSLQNSSLNFQLASDHSKNQQMMTYNKRHFFSSKGKEEKKTEKKEETAKEEEKKEQSSSDVSSSEAEEEVELSKEDVVKIKALIKEQDETIEKHAESIAANEKMIKDLKSKLIYQLAENDNTVKRYRK